MFFASIFVVFLDLFRGADLLFVRSSTIRKRIIIIIAIVRSSTIRKRKEQSGDYGDENESWFFAFFRKRIHIKVRKSKTLLSE